MSSVNVYILQICKGFQGVLQNCKADAQNKCKSYYVSANIQKLEYVQSSQKKQIVFTPTPTLARAFIYTTGNTFNFLHMYNPFG